jgi:hypothetical protein
VSVRAIVYCRKTKAFRDGGMAHYADLRRRVRGGFENTRTWERLFLRQQQQ